MIETEIGNYLGACGISAEHEDFFKPSVQITLDRPGAHYIPRPYVLKDGFPTVFGIALARSKGCVISDEETDKIIAPTCPFCFEALVLSLLTEGLGGPNAQAKSHLWLCRACSSSSAIPTSTVTAAARRLKDEDTKNASATPSLRVVSGAASAAPDPADTDRSGGESSGEFNPGKTP